MLSQRALAALALGNHVVERQIGGRHLLAAILAAAAVAGVDVAAVELHILPGELVITQQADDPRDRDLESHGVDPVDAASGSKLALSCESSRQPSKLKFCQLLWPRGVGLDMHDLSQLAAEQRESPADIDDADGLIKLIEHQHVGVECRGQRSRKRRRRNSRDGAMGMVVMMMLVMVHRVNLIGSAPCLGNVAGLRGLRFAQLARRIPLPLHCPRSRKGF